MTLKYKDLRSFQLDIIKPDKLVALAVTLEALSGVENPASSYPFFYNPGFKTLEDGWCLFRPEEEFVGLVQGGVAAWRMSKANAEFQLSDTSGRMLIVPSGVSDSQLAGCARHRLGGRFPVLACLHKEVPLVRASQAAMPGKR